MKISPEMHKLESKIAEIRAKCEEYEEPSTVEGCPLNGYIGPKSGKSHRRRALRLTKGDKMPDSWECPCCGKVFHRIDKS